MIRHEKLFRKSKAEKVCGIGKKAVSLQRKSSKNFPQLLRSLKSEASLTDVKQ